MKARRKIKHSGKAKSHVFLIYGGRELVVGNEIIGGWLFEADGWQKRMTADYIKLRKDELYLGEL